jgi:hypothetical protein
MFMHVFCAPHVYRWAVLPMGRLFDRISQKGPNKKCSGRTNLRPNFVRFWTKRAEKGAELFPPLLLSNSREVQEIFPLTQTNIFFLSANSFKKWIYRRTEFFSSAAEFFFWTGWKVLQRAGNTADEDGELFPPHVKTTVSFIVSVINLETLVTYVGTW